MLLGLLVATSAAARLRPVGASSQDEESNGRVVKQIKMRKRRVPSISGQLTSGHGGDSLLTHHGAGAERDQAYLGLDG
jgi:hypothetical protein